MNKKPKQTHAEKKDSPPAELLPAAADTALLFCAGGTTAARYDVVEKITTLPESAQRQMAREGYFPAMVRRRHLSIEATLRGAIRCLLARAERRAATALSNWPTMEWSEGAGLFTKKFLQTLKTAGVPGFNDNNSINPNKLLPGLEAWLSGDREGDKHELQLEGVSNWTDFQKKFQGLNEKLKWSENDHRLMDAGTAIEIGHAAQTIYFTQLDRLAEDLPGRLAGRTPAEIKTELEKTVKKIRTAVETEFTTRQHQAEQLQATQQTLAENVKGS